MATQLTCSRALSELPSELYKTNRRFKCLPCDIICCKVCAEKCHRALDHEVIFYGRTEFKCSCFTTKQCICKEPSSKSESNTYSIKGVDQNKPWCSYMLSSTYCIFQRLYNCNTCQLRGEFGICEQCKNTCHVGHEIEEGGEIHQGICGCGSGRQHGLEANNTQHPVACKNITPRIRITNPPKIGQHSAVVYHDSLYIFGGAFDFVTNDMFQYEFKTKVWYRVTQQGDLPGIRSAHSAVRYKNGMFIFGGVCGNERFQGLYRFDFDTHVWQKLNTKGVVPAGRYFSSCCIYRDSLFVFGGMVDDNHGDNQLFQLDLEKMMWSRVETNGVQVMHTNGMTSCVYGDSMYVFGGFNHNKSKFASTLYEFNFLTQTWTHIKHEGVDVPRRAYHTAVIYDHKMCIYGGKTPYQEQDTSANFKLVDTADKSFRMRLHREKIYTFDFRKRVWDTLPANFDVPNVFFHQSVVHGDRMYSVGGNDRKNNCYHFYEFNFSTNSWLRYDDEWHFLTTDIITHLVPEGLCYDVLFELENRVFLKAHRAILAQSPALMKMVSEDCWVPLAIAESGHSFKDMVHRAQSQRDSDESSESMSKVYLISLPSVNALYFQQLLYFLYGSEQLIIHDCLKLLDLMDLLNQFEMPHVLDMCSRAFESHLTARDVLKVLMSPKMSSFESLKEIAMRYIHHHYDDVVNLPDLNALSKDLLLEITRLRFSTSQISTEPLPVLPSPSLHLLQHLRHLRTSGQYSDVNLMAKDATKPFAAHRAILASQSEYFRNLFSGEYTDSFSKCVKLPASAQVVSILLDFFYEGTLNHKLASSSNTSRALDLDESDVHFDDDATSFFYMLLEVGHLADFISHTTLENAAKYRLLSEISLANVNAVLVVLSHFPHHKFAPDIKARCTYYLSSMPVERIISNFIHVVVTPETMGLPPPTS